MQEIDKGILEHCVMAAKACCVQVMTAVLMNNWI